MKKYVIYDEMNNQEVVEVKNEEEVMKRALELFNINIVEIKNNKK